MLTWVVFIIFLIIFFLKKKVKNLLLKLNSTLYLYFWDEE